MNLHQNKDFISAIIWNMISYVYKHNCNLIIVTLIMIIMITAIVIVMMMTKINHYNNANNHNINLNEYESNYDDNMIR